MMPNRVGDPRRDGRQLDGLLAGIQGLFRGAPQWVDLAVKVITRDG